MAVFGRLLEHLGRRVGFAVQQRQEDRKRPLRVALPRSDQVEPEIAHPPRQDLREHVVFRHGLSVPPGNNDLDSERLGWRQELLEVRTLRDCRACGIFKPGPHTENDYFTQLHGRRHVNADATELFRLLSRDGRQKLRHRIPVLGVDGEVLVAGRDDACCLG